MKQFSQASKETTTTVAPGVKRRILAFGGSLMMAQFNFNEGSSIPWHSHPHEQVSYVISGEAELYLEGQEPDDHSRRGGRALAEPHPQLRPKAHSRRRGMIRGGSMA